MRTRVLISWLLLPAAVGFLAGCGEEPKPPPPQPPAAQPAAKTEPPKEDPVTSTVKGVNDVADYATGVTQLQVKKKTEQRLEKIRDQHHKQLDDALKE